MKAAVLQATGGVSLVEVPRPEPGPDQVLVAVRACALNRADLAMLAGAKHGRAGGPDTILGLEWAGEVVACGAQVSEFNVGDRVMGSGPGAFAEFAVADCGRVMALPDAALDDLQAACLPVALLTMHDALVGNGHLRPGQSVLIQGASSGVGLMGLQIAKALGAGLVIGSSTTRERRERLPAFGADLTIDSSDPDWVDQVRAATSGRGVELVVDQLSGPIANPNMRAAAIGATIVNVGRLAGLHADFDFDLHAYRRLRYVGVTFRTRSVAQVRDIRQRMQADLLPHLRAGRLRLPIDRVFPFAALVEALAHMRANAHFGKIVVRLD